MSEQTLEELNTISMRALTKLWAAEAEQRFVQEAHARQCAYGSDDDIRDRLNREMVRASAKLHAAGEAATAATEAYEKRRDYLRDHPSGNGESTC